LNRRSLKLRHGGATAPENVGSSEKKKGAAVFLQRRERFWSLERGSEWKNERKPDKNLFISMWTGLVHLNQTGLSGFLLSFILHLQICSLLKSNGSCAFDLVSMIISFLNRLIKTVWLWWTLLWSDLNLLIYQTVQIYPAWALCFFTTFSLFTPPFLLLAHCFTQTFFSKFTKNVLLHVIYLITVFIIFTLLLYFFFIISCILYFSWWVKPQVHGYTDVVIKDIVPTWSYEFN